MSIKDHLKPYNIQFDTSFNYVRKMSGWIVVEWMFPGEKGCLFSVKTLFDEKENL